MAFAHIVLGISEGWRQRRTLRLLVQHTPPGRTVLDLQPAMLAERGVAVLVLDFDGVLAPHGADRPLPEVHAWLRQVVAALGEEKVFILSNRPHGPRMDWFRIELPGVRVISGVRKKPYPDGLVRAGELANVPLSAILMVDDRLLTGCLAAITAGCVPYYVRSPFVDLRQRPRKELFFMLLRWAERRLVRLSP